MAIDDIRGLNLDEEIMRLERHLQNDDSPSTPKRPFRQARQYETPQVLYFGHEKDTVTGRGRH